MEAKWEKILEFILIAFSVFHGNFKFRNNSSREKEEKKFKPQFLLLHTFFFLCLYTHNHWRYNRRKSQYKTEGSLESGMSDYRLNHETLKHSLCAIKIMGEYLPPPSCAKKKSSGRGLSAPFVISRKQHKKRSPFILINKISTPLLLFLLHLTFFLNSLKHITQFKDIF